MIYTKRLPINRHPSKKSWYNPTVPTTIVIIPTAGDPVDYAMIGQRVGLVIKKTNNRYSCSGCKKNDRKYLLL